MPKVKLQDSLFLHIPKTAGMSLFYTLEALYGTEHSLRFPQSTEEFRKQYMEMSDSELSRIKFLSGHFDLPTFLSRDIAPRVIFSVVREPVERLLSSYGYVRGWKDHPLHGTLGKMSLDEFVDYHQDPAIANRQCRSLCGKADFLLAREACFSHVDLLGSLEAIDLFIESLQSMLGLRLHLCKENVTGSRLTRDRLDASLCARILQANIEDYKLWSWVIGNGVVRVKSNPERNH